MPESVPRAHTLDASALKALVKARRRSWKAVAKACEVHVGTVKKWASGKQSIFTDNLVKLASFLDCTLDQLIGDEPSPALRRDKQKQSEPMAVAAASDPIGIESDTVSKTIMIEGAADHFTHKRIQAIIPILKEFAGGSLDTVKTLSITLRSLFVTLSMKPDQAKALEAAIHEGELRSTGLAASVLSQAAATELQHSNYESLAVGKTLVGVVRSKNRQGVYVDIGVGILAYLDGSKERKRRYKNERILNVQVIALDGRNESIIVKDLAVTPRRTSRAPKKPSQRPARRQNKRKT